MEIVYTILHGICQFTLLNFMRNEFTAEQMKQFRAMEYRVDRFGDTTITMRTIRINDIEKWDKLDSEAYLKSFQSSTGTSFIGRRSDSQSSAGGEGRT